MIMKTFISGPIDANNYLLIDGNEAVLIDCSDAKPELLKELENIKLKYILLTHGHFDHILGINEIRKSTNAKVLVHKYDVDRMKETSAIMKSFGVCGVEAPLPDDYVKDGDELTFGNSKIKVIETPGHTEGGVCYMVDESLFSGDTLFKDCVGRCDLPGGNFSKLKNSVQNILFNLDERTRVYPGHGPETSIKYEKNYNEIL